MFQSMSDTLFGTSSKSDIQNAAAEEVDSEQTFEVSQEEVSIIKADLALDFPEDYSTLSTTYISSVASKPYSKDPSIRRPIEYSTKKLKDVLKWRADHAVGLQDSYAIVSGKEEHDAAADSASAERVTKAKALATSLNYGSMYWHGLDKEGRPVLWIRTDRMVRTRGNVGCLIIDVRSMPHCACMILLQWSFKAFKIQYFTYYSVCNIQSISTFNIEC